MSDVFDIPGFFEQDMVVPVEGTMGGGFSDPRDGGLRKHNAGDIAAPAGTPLVAPGNMEFVDGRQGGTNLKSNDWWSHWRDTDTGRLYKFAHHGPISDYKFGQQVAKGEQWGVIGDAISGPHLHMAVTDSETGKNIDWLQPLGLKRGMKLQAGTTFAEAKASEVEQKAGKIAATTGNTFDIPNYKEGEVFDIPGASQPTSPTAPGGFLAPKQAVESEMTPDTLGQFAAPAGEMVGNFMDLPSKWLLRKPLEKIYDKFIAPQRPQTIEEWAQYAQNPGAGAAAPEAFAALPNKESFVTPLEIALQPALFRGLSKVGSLATELPQKAAAGLYASAMKIPPKSTPNWLRNQIIETGLEGKYGVSQSGLDKVGSDIEALNQQIKAAIGEAGDLSVKINASKVAGRLEDLRKYYANSLPNVRDKAIAIIDDLEAQMVNEGMISIAKAQAMKQNTYRDLKKAYGEMKGPEIEGSKALARGLKEEIAAEVPGISPLNAQESKLLNLRAVLDPAVNRVGNYDIIRMGDAIGTIMGGAMGGPHGAAVGLAARRLIDTPAMKARLGILLNSLNKNPYAPELINQFQTSAPFMAASEPLNRR